jgi:hypothetical protein
MHMPDPRLNRAEQALQHSFIKLSVFNALLVTASVWAAYQPIRALPARRASPPAVAAVSYQPVELAPENGPLRLVGAWEVKVADLRFGGISALAIDQGRFIAVSDRGSVARFDLPGTPNSRAWVADLRDGPGPWGRKWARDAESLARDPHGRGWWVGYEQHHSLWLYGSKFDRSLSSLDLNRPDWWNNRGAEGLVTAGPGLLVLAENGRDAMAIRANRVDRMRLEAGADVADAATAPDGSQWLLLRSKGARGISQSIAPLLRGCAGYRAGPAMPVPKGAFDNYEGMAIEPRAGGGMRFWLITDDGHRIMARTLLIALDYKPAGHDKGPATRAGPSKKPTVEAP